MHYKFSFSRLLWPAIGLALLVWLMSVAYGFQYLVAADGAARLFYFRVATVPFAGAVVLLTWYAARASEPVLDLREASWWLGLSMMSISWVLSCYFESAWLAPLPWSAAAVTVPLLATVAYKRWGYRGANLAFISGALSIFIFLIGRIPHDGGGDMLQIIGFAADDLLRGSNPFKPYLTVSGKDVPFGYWPGVWLPYVPLIALGLDMRVLNLCAFGLLVLMFWKVAGGGERGAAVIAITLLPFMLSSQILQMVLFGHLWLYWLLVCATLVLIVERRYVPAAVLFGLCLASRPTVLFLAGPIVAFVWFRESFRVAACSGAIALVVVLVLNAPFALIYGQDFLANSYGGLARIKQELTHFSLTGLLQAAGLDAWGRPMQVLVALGSFALVALKRSLPASQFIMFCGLTYVWQVLFATYATRYIYFPGFLLIALGLTVAFADKE